MQPIRLYIGLMLLFLAALVVGAFMFFSGMAHATYVVSDGLRYLQQFIDKPRYETNLIGFIYTLTFLVAGVLFLLLVLLPGEGVFTPFSGAAPQPRRRPAPPAARRTGAEFQAPPAPAVEAPTVAIAEEPPAPAPAPPAPAVAMKEPEPVAIDEAVVAEAPPPAPAKSIEEEVLTTRKDEDLPPVDLPDSRYEETDEDDVVYGSGPVSDDSIWDFIQQYPDSAVKFLYRKTLENKPLSPTDEDIYRRWEMRGMTRAKVREFVLALMKWKSLPDDFPHNIWRQLRDEIFEMQTKA